MPLILFMPRFALIYVKLAIACGEVCTPVCKFPTEVPCTKNGMRSLTNSKSHISIQPYYLWQNNLLAGSHNRKLNPNHLLAPTLATMPPIAVVTDDHSTNSSFSVKDSSLVKPTIIRINRSTVDFEDEPVVHEFEGIDDDNFADVWYCREDFDIIRSRNSLIVKMMKAGSFEESEEHSFRGLEHKLKAGFKQRRENKFNALNAVLEEQDRQFHRGLNNPDAIAQIYMQAALLAKESAYMLAIRDVEESYSFRGHPVRPDMLGDFIQNGNAQTEDGDDETVVEDDTDMDTVCSESSKKKKKKSRFRRLFSKSSKSSKNLVVATTTVIKEKRDREGRRLSM